MIERVLAPVLALFALAAAILMIGFLVASQAVVEDMPFAKEIRCALDLDADCLETDIAQLRAERAKAQDDLDRIEGERRAFQSGAAVQTNSGDLGGWYVSVSAIYDNPKTRTGLKAAICQAARDVNGPDHSLLLARLVDGLVVPETIDRDLARRLKFKPAHIEQGMAACPWPAVR